MIAMDNARQEQRSLIKPPIPPDQHILVRVQDALFKSFNQLPPAAAARDYHSTFGPALHAQSDQEQMATITSARDTYRERLEFVEAIKQLHQLGQTKGIVLTTRLMDILPTDDQMRQARAILYVLNNAAQARIASMETQELTSLRALQQHEEQLTALLWPTPQTSPNPLVRGGWELSPADKAALRDPYAGYFRE